MIVAIKVTEETVGYVIGFGHALNTSLSFLKEGLKSLTAEGDTLYMMYDGETFTPFRGSEFIQRWMFVNENPDKFSEIVRS